jgi:hypothetical protein
MIIKDMPKLECPFKREEINGKYICVPNLREEYKWILDPDLVIATEKFDGTNVSVVVENGNIKFVLNRTNRVDIWKAKDWFYKGIKRAIDEGKFKVDMCDDGQYFGELIGPKIQKNSYELTEPLWIPFDYVKNHYLFKFYYSWLTEQDFSTEENTLLAFSNLLRELKSIYCRNKGVEKQPEGIVFHNKITGEMCKLRCDMFDWFTGRRHKQNKEGVEK